MVDATVSKTVGHNARAGSTPALGTSFESNLHSKRARFCTTLVVRQLPHRR